MSSKGTALVTGAAQGIGRAIALRLAADGFDIALNDIAAKAVQLAAVQAEVTAAGRRGVVLTADVSDDAQVQAMVAETVRELGGLDVMVANAGVCKAQTSFMDLDVADWDRTFTINARGTFLCYKYAAKQMASQGRGGRIIGACSGAGKQGFSLLPDYSASKFAVRGLTQAAASDLGKHGITVNAYAPGAVETPMTAQFPVLAGADSEAFFASVNTAVYAPKNVTAEDIASLVSFLASKESSFITGQSINADGGRLFD
ncbi:NAD(P)-binding protein [Mycena sp. CBHHK59/15]|nr:NAD(P)-binding protein [Mycena sp. CBHHK59/15]